MTRLGVLQGKPVGIAWVSYRAETLGDDAMPMPVPVARSRSVGLRVSRRAGCMGGGKPRALTARAIRAPGRKGRRRRTLPQSLLCSTIRATRLNDRVRDGNGCDPRAIAADQTKHGCGELATSAACAAWVKVEEDQIDKCGLIKPHGRLVPLGSDPCGPCTCGLSTSSSRTALQRACALGRLVLGGASRLDAFSGSLVPT